MHNDGLNGSVLQTTARYISNNSEAHKQAVGDMEKVISPAIKERQQNAKSMQKLSPKLSPTKKGKKEKVGEKS